MSQVEESVLLGMPRTHDWIRLELEAAHKHREAIQKLQGEWAALDLRHVRVYDDGRVEKVGEYEMPENLREAGRLAAERVAVLQHELRRAYDEFTAQRR